MSDHLVLCVDRLITSAFLESTRGPKFAELTGAFGEGTSAHNLAQCEAADDGWDAEEFAFSDDGDAGGETAGCRICHEEDFSKKMEVPCACNGSLKFAHRKCVQRWCNEKKNTICEICRQPYQAGYTAPPPVARCEVTALDIRESQNIPGSPSGVHSPRVVAATAAAEHFLEAEYDECVTASGARTAIIRSSVLILLAVLMMRHAFSLVDEEDNDLYNLLPVFLVRILAFLMPVYIMAWIATVLLCRSQRHEVGGLGAAEVAILLPQFIVSSETQDSSHES